MKMPTLIATFAATLLVFAGAAAQTWPDRPIRIVVGAQPGASGDTLTRLVADKLSKALNQTVVVENRPGGGGTIGVRAGVTAKPDGYTLLSLYSDTLVVAPFLAKTPPYDALKDLTYVGGFGRSSSFILAVNPAVPAQTFEEYIRLAKASPKPMTFSSYGLGSVPQLGFEMMAEKAGIQLLHVPYKGGAESYQAAVAGYVDAVAGTSFVELLRSGRLRPLAIGGNRRSPLFPNVPTMSELGYGTQIFGPVTYSLAVPAGTPKDIVNRLAVELKRITEQTDVAQKMATVASEPNWIPGDEYLDVLRQGVSLYEPVIRRLGLSTQ
ncbi:MAG: tripartite tricarboxylate transporter substrate binding protein [Burkholderiaceae bacterium]|nr:tripartite tricarboxylate transporter substrate binding protein [Burkholderiaceae bacterium]